MMKKISNIIREHCDVRKRKIIDNIGFRAHSKCIINILLPVNNSIDFFINEIRDEENT